VSEGRYPDGALTIFRMLTPTPRAENVILNTPPILTHIPDQIVYAGHAVHFTASATDAEIAVQQLVFSLEPGAVRIFDFSKELRDVNPKALRIEK
jgi:hypothetical protein